MSKQNKVEFDAAHLSEKFLFLFNHPPVGGCPRVAGNLRLRSKSESAAAVRDPSAEVVKRDAMGVGGEMRDGSRLQACKHTLLMRLTAAIEATSLRSQINIEDK